jgi:hypothetical protein
LHHKYQGCDDASRHHCTAARLTKQRSCSSKFGLDILFMIKSDWNDDDNESDEDDADVDKRKSITASRPAWDMIQLDNNNNNNLDGSTNLRGFNPLNYDASKSMIAISSSQRVAGKSNRISLRATQMQELNRQLLDAVGFSKDRREEELRAILQQYQDFLLEPLEDFNAVLEEDSIYSSQMSRSGRYQAFRRSLSERIESSKNLKVKAALEAMRDFVLEFE